MNQHINKMWHSYISVLMYSHIREKNYKQSRVEYYTTIKESGACYNMDEPQAKEFTQRDHILLDFMYMRCPEKAKL